jgi:hypothetical protein
MRAGHLACLLRASALVTACGAWGGIAYAGPVVTARIGTAPAPFGLLDLGSSPAGTNGLVTTSAITTPDVTITFDNPGGQALQAGVYTGNVANVVNSPFSDIGQPATKNYLAAEPGANVVIISSAGHPPPSGGGRNAARHSRVGSERPWV